MDKTLLKNTLEDFKSLVNAEKTPELKAAKLKELLKEDLKKNQNFDLISGTRKGLTEMFQEINKKELSEEIGIAIKLLEYFEFTSSFGLVSIPLNEFSSDESDKFNNIKSQWIAIVGGK